MANRGASSSSSVPFTKSWKYHVFLSFRGFDTRSNFTSHLYSALRLQGINTFMDDDELRRGEEISNALLTEIKDSKISVVVFSENYASSKWCLDELVKILDCKESNQQLVIPVFYKVNPSDVRNHRGSFGDALANMERRYKDEMDKVNKWRAAISQAAALSGFTLDEHRSEAELIHKIVQDISREVIDRTYLHVTEYPVGMHHPATWVEWAFLLTALCLEILSLAFDQATSPSKPQYALFGMILAIAAVFICIWELIYKGIKGSVVLRPWGRLWWFYYPDPPHRLFGTVLDFYGLVGGIAQCICSTVQYVFFLRHADNPIKASLWPAIFVICLGAKRLNDNRNEIHRD